MMTNKYKNYLIITILMSFCFSALKSAAAVLPVVVLSGDKGGLTNGAEWHSSSLKDKINLILYVDPDKKGDAEPLVHKLDSLNYSPDTLNITFILNTAATIIPNFIIHKMIKKKAKKSDTITYVLDERKVLVKKWNLADNEINILLLDADGNILEKHQGNMTTQYLNQFINKIDNLINKGA